MPDPVVTFTAITAVTSVLRLELNLFIPVYRNPFLAATALLTLDVISGGRLTSGSARGTWRRQSRRRDRAAAWSRLSVRIL
jgi:alkanesulfonate monooxygenase SsuD/methylene tetrahydromethanopterin reductase-like flavin-dependent oxidoreductase (luciferase family)